MCLILYMPGICWEMQNEGRVRAHSCMATIPASSTGWQGWQGLWKQAVRTIPRRLVGAEGEPTWPWVPGTQIRRSSGAHLELESIPCAVCRACITSQHSMVAAIGKSCASCPVPLHPLSLLHCKPCMQASPALPRKCNHYSPTDAPRVAPKPKFCAICFTHLLSNTPILMHTKKSYKYI